MKDRIKAAHILKWIQTESPDLIGSEGRIRPGTEEEDKNQLGDAMIEFPDKPSVAVGFHESERSAYPQIWFRYENEGFRTEVDKIQAGRGKWFMFAWHEGGIVHRVVLIDLDKMRRKGWFEGDLFGGLRWKGERMDERSSRIYILRDWAKREGFVDFDSAVPQEVARTFLRPWTENLDITFTDLTDRTDRIVDS